MTLKTFYGQMAIITIICLGILGYVFATESTEGLHYIQEDEPSPITPATSTRPAILVRIAECESGDIHFLPSGEVVRGRINPLDVGRYQINLHYHQAHAESLGLDLLNEVDNETFALLLYKSQGTTPWNWSRECWIN